MDKQYAIGAEAVSAVATADFHGVDYTALKLENLGHPEGFGAFGLMIPDLTCAIKEMALG